MYTNRKLNSQCELQQVYQQLDHSPMIHHPFFSASSMWDQWCNWNEHFKDGQNMTTRNTVVIKTNNYTSRNKQKSCHYLTPFSLCCTYNKYINTVILLSVMWFIQNSMSQTNSYLTYLIILIPICKSQE